MKKLIVLSLVGILIFVLGTTVYAQAPKLEFRVSGFIDAQTFWDKNVPPRNTTAGLLRVTNPTFVFWPNGLPTNGYNKNTAYWDSRAHLKMDMVMGPNLSGTIYFEIDTSRGGAPFSNYPGNGREANNFGAWTTDRAAVEVKNIYIDFGLPYFGIPVPITVRVGAQPMGIRPAMLVYSDGFGITAAAKIDPVQINFYYAKPLEGLDFAADDCDVYGAAVSAKLGTFTVGGYGMWWNMNTYPFFVTTTAASFLNPALAALNPAVQGTYQSTMWWMGLYADGKAGPLNINYDLLFDWGNVQSKLGLPFPKVNYFGWATRAKIDYPWEKFNFGVVGMYASGSDAKETSASGLPGSIVAWGTNGVGAYANVRSKKVTGYVVPPGSEQDTNNQESIVVYAMESGASGGAGIAENANYSQLNKGAFGGTWFAKLYGSAKLTPWYKVTLQGLYIGDTTKNGATLGSAVKYPGTNLPYLKDPQSIGWELDLINEIWIYNNLRFMFGGGILWNAHDAIAVSRSVGGIFSNVNPQAPWAVRTRLVYTF